MKLISGMMLLITVGGMALLSSGCASLFPGGPTPAGVIFTNVRSPAQNLAVATDAAFGSQKHGTSSAGALFGLFAFGDASVDAAMKAGGITKVHHVDHQVNFFLFGIWRQNKTIVYGE